MTLILCPVCRAPNFATDNMCWSCGLSLLMSDATFDAPMALEDRPPDLDIRPDEEPYDPRKR